MTAKEYIEAVAAELGRVRGGGLFLSPSDAQLALSWHGLEVPLETVIAELRRVARLKPAGSHLRGALRTALSLQLIAQSVESRARVHRRKPALEEGLGLRDELHRAAQSPGLAGRAAWEALAEGAEELLTHGGGEGYWTAAVRALRSGLRELPRTAALQAGAALRSRLAPRPRGMPRRRYQRSLQLMLLSAASERLGLPPRAFLL